MNTPFSISIEELLNQLKVDKETGLSREEVARRLNQYGVNEISKTETAPWWSTLLSQFKNPMVYLMLFAAVMSFYFQEWLDGSAILVVILINAAIGFYMELQAGQSMEALQKLSSIPSKVIRDGKLQEIDAEELVPGDILFIEAGDMVAADARLTKLAQLQMNEATLTGESVPVDKNIDILQSTTPLAEQYNMIFKGSFVSRGNARAIVTATGMSTELGKIAHLTQQAQQAATPLEKKLEQFSKKLIQVTVFLVLAIFFAGWALGHELFEMINTSIALAVAAIPEGLPIVATLALAKGMLKMARHNVIVKKLSAVETLGGTTVICTDKTGTLTENRMTVQSIIPSVNATTQEVIQAGILCNTAEINEKGHEVGDPLDIALLKYATSFQAVSNIRAQYRKVEEEPFSSDTKRMITVHQNGNGFIAFAKGAVEEILSLCSSSQPSTNTGYQRKAEQLATAGYKVIALAKRGNGKASSVPVSDFDFMGIVSLIDPPRKEVPGALAECRSAGIDVVMITGDHPNTAKEIGKQLGLLSPQDSVILGASMKPFEELTNDDRKAWRNAKIFARVTPAQKLDLIKVFQEQGDIVGMTGDGVNDAPALKKADIGIAMGLRGTQVAQDVADMVLKDDSFSSIVSAIRQGRIIFDNIRKFVIFLLSCNLSELFTIAVTAVLNLHFQLFPLQILFINLITDVLPALALGVTPGNENVMREKPRSSKEPIIGKSHWGAIIFYSCTICLASLGAVLYSHFGLHTTEGWNSRLCNNILFFTLILSQLFHVFNMNATDSNFFTSEVIRNKFTWYSLIVNILLLLALYEITPVRNVLSIYPLSVSDWAVIVSFSLAGMMVNQMAKKFKLIKQ